MYHVFLWCMTLSCASDLPNNCLYPIFALLALCSQYCTRYIVNGKPLLCQGAVIIVNGPPLVPRYALSV